MKAHRPHGVESAQTLHHIGFGLLDDHNVPYNDQQNQQDHDNQDN